MRLYLMQHGKPVIEEVNPARPLSDQGRGDVKKIAEFLKRVGVNVPVIFHSGKTRAKETAEIVAATLGQHIKVEERPGVSPLDNVRRIADEIHTSRGDIFIAGHLPHLAKLTAFLVTANEMIPVARFQQGGVACLERDDAGKWMIAWMVVPDVL
jgi:phosphohistidine phosphatase